MTKINIDFEQLSSLVAMSRRNGTQDAALNLCLDWAKLADDRVIELEIENKQLHKKRITYSIAKAAIALYESEYIGQASKPLWDWALQEAIDKATKE